MRISRLVFIMCLILLLPGMADSGFAAEVPDTIAGSIPHVYKEVDGASLKLFVFSPPDEKQDARPAIVFFFGGGWNGGTPVQFAPHCEALSKLGMVAISAEYRVKSRHGVLPEACVRDTKSALRWVRANAGKLGVDPDRIAAAGGSAGGHLAACAGVIEGFEEAGEDHSISSRANAMVLFNPVLVIDGSRAARFGGPDMAKALSPIEGVEKGAPPCIIFHGSADTTVPFETARAFTEKMKAMGNDCELVVFKGEGHGFFNKGRGDGSAYESTLAKTVGFLRNLGYIEKAGVE